MSSSELDSLAVFAARMKQLGLDSLYDIFVQNGWDTHAKFAFSSSSLPGGDNEKAFSQNVLSKIFSSPDDNGIPSVRRLFFESSLMLSLIHI